MTDPRRFLHWLVLSLGTICTSLGAQETHLFSVQFNSRSHDKLAVQVDTRGAPAHPGGWTWIEVRVHNPDDRPHDADLTLRSPQWGVSHAECKVEIRIEPNETVSRILPLVGTGNGTQLVILADGYRSGAASFNIPESGECYGFRGLVISDSLAVRSDWEGALQRQTDHIDVGHTWTYTGGKREKVDRQAVRSLEVSIPEKVPDQWRLISGFDFVLVDCGSSTPAALQQTIVDYARAGGHVMLIGSGRLDRASILGQLIHPERSTAREPGVLDYGSIGFGSWLAIVDDVDADRFSALVDQSSDLARWFDPERSPVFCARRFSGPSPSNFLAPGKGIPGVGEVSRGVFLILLLGFAILVGPINYVFWRRRRQLAMLLLTVPAAGFVFTVVTLTWGLLSDGLGVQGVMGSVTILDQRTHDAVSWSAERLYAGLTPSALRPRVGTWVGCDEVTSRRRHNSSEQHQLELTLPAGGLEIGGQAVPARSMTNLRTVAVGTERARLRFVRTDGGRALECVAGSSFAPTSRQRGVTAVVVRDHGGRYFAGADGGPMEQLAGNLVAETLATMWLPYFPLVDVAVDSLPRGTYLARTDSDPARDDLGLSVEWHERHHYVFGWMAEEDIGDGN